MVADLCYVESKWFRGKRQKNQKVAKRKCDNQPFGGFFATLNLTLQKKQTEEKTPQINNGGISS